VNEPDSDAAPDPRKPYVPPALEELGDVDDQTGSIVASRVAEPGE
jgi:hypothetical protein